MAVGRWSQARAWIDTGYAEQQGGSGRERSEELWGVDELADACDRLVVLGEPGSGKSWYARRCAIRAAFASLDQLRDNLPTEEIELPLFVRCADLAARGGAWDTLVDATVDAVRAPLDRGDLTDVVRAGLKVRRGRFVVVLDGLDEAEGLADDELVDRLVRSRAAGDVRVILTSRKASWRRQLELTPEPEGSTRRLRRLAELQPLQYPQDVHGVIESLLGHDPGRARALIDLLDARPELAEASTTPLLCTLYCLLAGTTTALPSSGPALFERVVTRLVGGGWHPDRHTVHGVPQAVRKALQVLASTGAVDDTLSGLGAWPDVVTDRADREQRVAAAVSNVAPEVPHHPDRSERQRRFMHRAIREHLLAEHLAAKKPAKAAARLEPHLWFDPEWHPVIPSVLALHPGRDELLARLVTGEGDVSPDQSHLARRDGFGELQGLLRALSEVTSPDQWAAPASQQLINGVAHGLVASRAGWPGALPQPEHLRKFAKGDFTDAPRPLSEWVAGAGLDEDTRCRLVTALARLLQRGKPDASVWASSWKADAAGLLVSLGPDDTERAETFEALERRLEEHPNSEDALVLEMLRGAPVPDTVCSAVKDRVDDIAADPERWGTDYHLLDLVEVLERLGARGHAFSACVEALVNRLTERVGQDDDDDKYFTDLPGLVRALGRHGDDQQRARAIDLMLRRTVSGSYEQARQLKLTELLLPDGPSGSVLIRLCALGPWPDTDMAGQLIARLATAATDADRDAAVRDVVMRIERPGIGQDMQRWSRHLRALDPRQQDARATADHLLARLPDTPDDVIGWLVQTLPEIGANDGQRQQAVDDLLERMHRHQGDRVWSLAFIKMIAELQPTAASLSAVLDPLLGLVADADQFDITLRLTIGAFGRLGLEDQGWIRVVDALLTRAGGWTGSDVASLSYDLAEWGLSDTHRERVIELLTERISAADDLDDAESLWRALTVLDPARDVRAASARAMLALRARTGSRMNYALWSRTLPGLLSRAEEQDLLESLIGDSLDRGHVDEGLLSLMDQLGHTPAQDQRITDSLVDAVATEWSDYTVASITERIARRTPDQQQCAVVRGHLLRRIRSTERLGAEVLERWVRSMVTLGITDDERRELALAILDAAERGNADAVRALAHLEPLESLPEDVRHRALLLELRGLGKRLSILSPLSAAETRLLTQLGLDAAAVAEFARTAHPDQLVLREVARALRRTLTPEQWHDALELWAQEDRGLI